MLAILSPMTLRNRAQIRARATMARRAMHRRHLAFLALAGLLATAAPPAQTTGTAVVLSRLPGTPAALLLDVDLATGAFTVLPGFPSQHLPPLALTIDPIDGSLLLALDQTGQSRIVRLQPAGPAFAEQVLGTVPGAATDLLLDRFGDVVIATSGSTAAVHRLPRHGGAPRLVRSIPNLGAMAGLDLAWGAQIGISGRTGPPASDPGYAELDLDAGQLQAGPVWFPNFVPRGITGLCDLPTAVPRQVLAHDDGTFSLFSLYFPGNPVPVLTTPVLPAGGAVAMKGNGPALVLGGLAHPFLYGFDPTTALAGTMTLTLLAGPLPADPVDFARRPDGGAALLPFARGCGTAAELHVYGRGGAPRPGNLGFSIDLTQGLPAAPALLALGFQELPGTPLPNGCPVRLLPAAVAFHLTDPAGDASQPLPVPNQPALLGTLLFAQWFQDDLGLPFVTSRVLAIRVGT